MFGGPNAEMLSAFRSRKVEVGVDCEFVSHAMRNSNSGDKKECRQLRDVKGPL